MAFKLAYIFFLQLDPMVPRGTRLLNGWSSEWNLKFGRGLKFEVLNEILVEVLVEKLPAGVRILNLFSWNWPNIYIYIYIYIRPLIDALSVCCLFGVFCSMSYETYLRANRSSLYSSVYMGYILDIGRWINNEKNKKINIKNIKSITKRSINQ